MRFLHKLPLFILLCSFGLASAQAASIRYVSDDLSIPMRSGTTTRHKILKFINSGSEVKAQETNEDGTYTHITYEDTEGWVETKYLTQVKSAKDRLELANKKLEDNQNKIKSLNNQIKELETRNKKISSDLNNVTDEKSGLENNLQELRKTAARPIEIYENNKKLQDDLDNLRSQNDILATENANLKDKSLKEWFMIGAAVALGSLILGMIIPSIRWRKKSSWGDGF